MEFDETHPVPGLVLTSFFVSDPTENLQCKLCLFSSRFSSFGSPAM